MTDGPYILSKRTSRGIMLDVLIALIPPMAAGILFFGLRALWLTAFCAAVCLLSEMLFCLTAKKKQTIGDLSAVLTGVLLAFSLPVNLPLWQAAVGCVFAVMVVKMLFGGIGENFANPAVTARIFLFLSFAESMTDWSGGRPLIRIGTFSSATPLASDEYALKELFFGLHSGCVGETCTAALIIGGIYLVFRRVITPTIPLAVLGGAALMSLAVGADPIRQLFSGSIMLAAVYMATDYATSPVSEWGKLIYGAGIGVITVVIRLYGSYPEGVSFAILLMNIVTPLIDKLTYRRPFGSAKKESA